MPIPPSLLRDGYSTPEQARHKVGSKTRRLLIGTEGRGDTGKTEFLLTCPGPGIILCLDRGFDAMLDNPDPPKSRRDDFAFKIITAPVATQAVQSTYLEHFRSFREEFYKALAHPDARTVCIDGDSDSWELQRLAEHGKLTGVFPQTRYTDVYAARRALYNRAWDAGKIVVATNKVKAEYQTVRDAQGNPVLDDNRQERREKTGEYERQGFPDQEYLWQIQLRHLYDPGGFSKELKRRIPRRWGIRILKCKANTAHVGTELWGEHCTFSSLVQLVYPHVSLSEWGL